MFFHVFGHVNANYTAFVVEKSFGESFCQFGFSYAGRSEKDKRSDWAIWIFDTCAGTENRFADGSNCFILSDNSFMQSVFQVQKFFAFAHKHFCKRNARPTTYNAGNVFFADFFFQKAIVFILRGNFFFKFFQSLHELRELAVFEFGRFLKIVSALRLFNFVVDGVNFFFNSSDAENRLLFRLPFIAQIFFLLLKLRNFFGDRI